MKLPEPFKRENRWRMLLALAFFNDKSGKRLAKLAFAGFMHFKRIGFYRPEALGALAAALPIRGPSAPPSA